MPKASHYQMTMVGFPSNPQESLTACYENLRCEAIKYIEDGAESMHIYTVAMDALQIAAEKVAASKKRGFGLKQNTMTNGCESQSRCTVGSETF